MTTLNVIDELESTGIINILKGERKGQSHRLYINDNNELNILISEINRLEKIIGPADDLISTTVNKEHKDIFPQKHIPNLIQSIQLHIFRTVTRIATSIDKNIASSDDRDDLYIRLVKVMIASNKLSKIIEPELIKGLELMRQDLKKVGVIK